MSSHFLNIFRGGVFCFAVWTLAAATQILSVKAEIPCLYCSTSFLDVHRLPLPLPSVADMLVYLHKVVGPLFGKIYRPLGCHLFG